MTTYDLYKKARDLSWEILIKSRITALPVDLKTVADYCGVDVISFKRAVERGMIPPENAKGYVFVKLISGRKTIFVNNALKDSGSVRFSIAKGIGYCLLSDSPWYVSKDTEYAASIFARDLLMPAAVLFALKMFLAEDIVHLCAVSSRAAAIRSRRMKALSTRKRFNAHPLERQVSAQFKDFIDAASRKKSDF
ncbi:hypothetical protein IMSAG049_00130 [Clostridiales bacterium]|nr:hypothetical protein IMSAG049_00130 [Clostridiales bacterium]